jgi:hypothetical protein
MSESPRPRLFFADGDRRREVSDRFREYSRVSGNATSGFQGCAYLPTGHTDLVFFGASRELVDALTGSDEWFEAALEELS